MALTNFMGSGYTVIDRVSFSKQEQCVLIDMITFLNANKQQILAQWHSEYRVRTDGHPVKSRQLSAPPESPEPGDEYLIGASPTGAWEGLESRLVVWTGEDWADRGEIHWVYVEDEGVLLGQDGEGWVRAPAAVSQAEFDALFSVAAQDGEGNNLLKLCYEYLKTRPEYAGVEDA